MSIDTTQPGDPRADDRHPDRTARRQRRSAHLVTALVLATVASLAAACYNEPEAVTEAPAPPVEPATAAEPEPIASPTEPAVPDDPVKLDLNSASSEELATVPDTGPRMVHEFEEYRPYVSIRQFRREMAKYVDAERIAAYEEHLYVPIDPDASDSETLEQLPGVGPEEAEALAAGRPYGSAEAFLARLAELVGDEQAEAGAAYLVAR